LSYRPLKKVWVDKPMAVRVRVNNVYIIAKKCIHFFFKLTCLFRVNTFLQRQKEYIYFFFIFSSPFHFLYLARKIKKTELSIASVEIVKL
jgi:hypothetical protein